MTRRWQKRERESGTIVMGWKTVWAKSFYCVIGAAREFVVTALHLFTNAKDDGPLMSFTVVWLSQRDWLVTVLSLNISIISLLGCIRTLLDVNLYASLFLDALLTEVSSFRCVSQRLTHFWRSCNRVCERAARQETGCLFFAYVRRSGTVWFSHVEGYLMTFESRRSRTRTICTAWH